MSLSDLHKTLITALKFNFDPFQANVPFQKGTIFYVFVGKGKIGLNKQNFFIKITKMFANMISITNKE